MSATGTVTTRRAATEDESDLAQLLHRYFPEHPDSKSGNGYDCQQCIDAAAVILQRFGKGGN